MAKKTARLPREEFRARGYRTIVTPFFLIKFKKNAAKGVRVGVVAGKTVAKTAAERNFWKRQTKETVAKNTEGRIDVLIILSPRVTGLTRKNFREAIANAAGKIPKSI